MVEVDLDLDPKIVQLLDIYRGNHSRSAFINYMIALYHEGMQTNPRAVTQVQNQAYSLPTYVESLDEVEPIGKAAPFDMNRNLGSILSSGSSGTRTKSTQIKSTRTKSTQIKSTRTKSTQIKLTRTKPK